MLDQVLSITLISLIFLLAGLVKGVLGMGLPTVAIGILGGRSFRLFFRKSLLIICEIYDPGRP